MPNYLIFDTSANGKPRNWQRPADDIFNWPRMIHIAWEMYDNDQKLIKKEDHIIQPVGFTISEETATKHGVTQEMAEEQGVDIKGVLMQFKEDVNASDVILSHNLRFNENVVGAEFVRANIRHNLHISDKYCMMEEGTYFCRIPGTKGRYKWPTLTELFQKLFKGKYEGAGNATNDVLATSACFFRLLNAGQLEDMF